MHPDLQIILALLGAFIVVAVYLFSKWQQHRRVGARRKSATLVDALKRGFRRRKAEAPANAKPGAQADAAATHPAGAQAPEISPTPEDEGAALLQPIDMRPPKFANAEDEADENDDVIAGFSRLSQIDYWVKISGERDVGRETVLALYREGGARFGKKHGIHGLKIPEKKWRDVEQESEDARFADLVATIQLADRNGAISSQEMADFLQLASTLAAGTGREFSAMTTVENAFAQADALAKFIVKFNTVFALKLHPQEDEAFNGKTIDGCAKRLGLERDDNRYYSRFKSVGRGKMALYSLANLSDSGQFNFPAMDAFSTRGLTFFIRPALHHSPGAAFAEMVDTARIFASRIKAEIRASGNGELTQEEVDETRRTIEEMEREMKELGIEPGGEAAVRIF